MKISLAELEEKLIKAARQVVSAPEAEYFALENIETHIRKAPRSNPLKSAVDDLSASIKNKDKNIEYKVNLGSYLAIDFHSQGPLVYIKKIHDELEKRSKQNGIAMIAFQNSTALHVLHAWVQGLAKRGLVSIVSNNGGPGAVIPFNGTKGLFGTNPIAYGIPGANGKIFCVDMATSEIPYFEILDANKENQPLRERSAVDGDGEFTSDAKKALDFSKSQTDPVSNIVPMGGGYKGYYIVYLLELLTSGVIGMPSSPEMNPDFVPEEHGAFLLVINPKALGTKNNLQESVEALHNAIKTQKPKDGTSIRIPGEENNSKYEKLKNSDLEIDDSLLERLDNLIKDN